MKLYRKNRLFILGLYALGLSSGALAQTTSSTSPTSNQGLLGTTYAGAEFGYMHRIEGSPDVMRRYGFVYNQPLPEGLDFTFKYDHLTGSEAGSRQYSNGFLLGLTGYVPQTWGKPFLMGDIGWTFGKDAGVKSDSFAYKIKGGVEFQILPALVLTPYIAYEEAPHFGEHAWKYGAKAVYRVNRQWSGGLGAEIDENHNIEYTVGVNFHY